MAVGTALCDHSLDNYAFFDPNLGCTKLHHNPAPFIRGFMPLTTTGRTTPVGSSLRGRDTTAIDRGVTPEVLEQISWGVGIGLQTNADGHRVAFHWGDNGTGRNLAAVNLTTGNTIVCLTNSANGPASFRTIAEPVVGDLSSISQWLSKREDLPMEERVNPAQDIRRRLQELKPISITDDAALDGQQEIKERSSGSDLS